MNGAEVFGADGEKVGSIAEVYPGYIVVEKGFFFPTDYYIPRTSIAQTLDGQIYLNVSKDQALHSGWDTAPMDLQAESAATAVTDVDVGVTPEVAATQVAAEDELRIPLMEEELTATVRPRDVGAVRIEKDVITEERVLDVPVTQERVRVEHRVVDRPVTGTEAEAFEDVVIDVPIREEVVDVQKQARVTEEVIVSKEAEQRTEQVRGTVRREEVHVDEDATIDPNLIEGNEGRSSRAI